MTGQPVKVGDGRSATRALSKASLAFGSTALAIAAALVVLRNVNSPDFNVWPALVFLVPLAVMMVLTHVQPTLTVTIAYLAIGSASIGFYAAILITNAPESIVESPFILALPQLAFIYTIAPTVLGVRSIVYIASAYLLGAGSVLLAAAHAGRYPAFDYVTALSALIIIAVASSNVLLGRRSALDQRAIEKARREADADAYQQEIESQVVALFHDTVLSELTVLSHQEPGELKEAQRQAIERDLALIRGGDWWGGDGWGGDGPGEREAAGAGVLPPLFAEAIEGARASGIRIDLAGDLASLHRLTGPVSTATALALAQALVNVRLHSGVQRAEVMVDGAADAVVVMVADAGRGFDAAAIPDDRLGVTQSILGRIRDAGASAQLWTAPGNGTAYLFTLPVAPQHEWPGRRDDR